MGLEIAHPAFHDRVDVAVDELVPVLLVCARTGCVE